MQEDSKKYFLIPIITFLLVVLVLTLIYFRVPTFLFPKASVYNMTGKWQINTVLTSPQSESFQELATLIQDANGHVTGTVTDMNGADPLSISGTVTGNHFVSDPINFSGTEMGIAYAGSYTMTGTIANGNLSISGTISGQMTKPNNDTISGTFTGTRLEGPTSTPIPTATPIPTPTATIQPTATATATGEPTDTPDPTDTPTAAGTVTPAPTITYRTPFPGYTNPPIPSSGVSLPTIFEISTGLILLSLSLLLVL